MPVWISAAEAYLVRRAKPADESASAAQLTEVGSGGHLWRAFGIATHIAQPVCTAAAEIRSPAALWQPAWPQHTGAADDAQV